MTSAENLDDVSVTKYEVESAMNHRHQRATLRDHGFSNEAFNTISSADAYIRATRDGLTRATEQYLKDVRVSTHLFKFGNYIYQLPLRLEAVGTTDLRIVI